MGTLTFINVLPINPAVLIRLLATIGRLGPKMRGAEDRISLWEQVTAVWETANTRAPVKMDRDDIELPGIRPERN